jgi:hypothetical protein
MLPTSCDTAAMGYRWSRYALGPLVNKLRRPIMHSCCPNGTGGWRSWLAHQHDTLGVTGSSPVPPIFDKSADRRKLRACPVGQCGRPQALETLRQHMIELGWIRKSINRQVHRVCSIFRWAASKELVPASIYERLKTLGAIEARPNQRPRDAPGEARAGASHRSAQAVSRRSSLGDHPTAYPRRPPP